MDVIEIVEKLEMMGLIRANKIINSYYSIYCPFHSQGQEKKASFGILIREEVRHGKVYPTGWSHCFTCSYVNTLPGLIEDILKSRFIAQSGIDWLKQNIPGFDVETDFEYLIPPDMTEEMLANWSQDKLAISAIEALKNKTQSFITEDELARYRFTVPYMYQRKLTDEVIERYDIGFDQNWIAPGRKTPTPCITFPVHDSNGNVLYIYRRAIDTKFFSMPEGLQKVVYGLYQLPKVSRRVVVTEAILNALTAVVYGDSAVALYGTGNAYQIEQLRRLGVHEFILGFDPDEGGRRATARLKKALRDVAIVWSYADIPEGKDINDLTYDEYKSLTLE